jgi:hypothetical protein
MSLKEELKKLKKKMKEEEEESKLKAQAQAYKKEGALHKSIESLLGKTSLPISSLPAVFCRCSELFSVIFLGTADMPVDHTNKLRVDSMSHVLSFVVDSNQQIQELLKKAKGALSKLFLLMFPKLDQNKTLGKLANTFFVDSSSAIEVLKRLSRLYRAVLTFQLLMGHGFKSDLELLSKALAADTDGSPVDLGPFNESTCVCASQLLNLVDDEKKKTTSETAPSSYAQTQKL